VTAWEDYLTVAAQLDAVRRDEAAAVVAQEAGAASAAAEIAVVRRRIAMQRTRIGEIAGKASIPIPALDPMPADRAVATAIAASADSSEAADPAAGVTAAVRAATATLDAADATLFAATNRGSVDGLLPTWPPLLRNGIVYFWFAALSMVAIAQISNIAGPSEQAGVLVTVFAVLVPLCAWVVAWLSVGMLFGADEFGNRPRSVLLGALLVAVPLLVGLLLAAH
jgi:hypothetical protein